MANPTTVNVSPAFAAALRDATYGTGKSIALFCDENFLKRAQGAAAQTLEDRLARMRAQPEPAGTT